MKRYLNVPYRDIDAARSKGALYDLARKQWYVMDTVEKPINIFDFIQWAPEKKATKSEPLKHLPFVVVQPRTPRKKNWGTK
jgi:hypothetical protein